MLHATSVKDTWKKRPKVRQKNSAKFGVSKCLSCFSMFVRRLPLAPYKSMSTHVDLHLNVFQNAVNGPQSSNTSSSSPRRHARECLAKNFATFGALTSSRAPPWSSLSMARNFRIIPMECSASMNIVNVCRHSEKCLH